MKRIYGLILLILLLVILFLVSCERPQEKNDVNKETQDKIIAKLGKTNDKKIVVKRLDVKDYESYYVFKVENTYYEQYCYNFYLKKEDYDEAIKKYSSGIYRLEKDEDGLMVKIYATRGNKSGDEDLYEALIKIYSDTSKYEIIK